MYGCGSWTIKKSEHQRIDAFELWCWRRLLRVPWTARRSNPSILKEISSEYSLEGLMLKLKLQYFWPPDAKNQLIRKDPGAGRDGRQEKKGMTADKRVLWHHCLNGHESEQSQGDGEGQGSLVCCSSWSQTWPPDWTTFPIINGTDAYRLLVRMLLTLWPTSFALEFLDVNITST